jgi:hypothetical protein
MMSIDEDDFTWTRFVDRFFFGMCLDLKFFKLSNDEEKVWETNTIEKLIKKI